MVMNPFSRFDLERSEFERELTDTVNSIKNLNATSFSFKKIHTFGSLQKKIADLENDIKTKEQTIQQMAKRIEP
jgi:hypothetical protein